MYAFFMGVTLLWCLFCSQQICFNGECRNASFLKADECNNKCNGHGVSFTEYETVKATEGSNDEEGTKNSLKYGYFFIYNAKKHSRNVDEYKLYLIFCSFASCATTTTTVIVMMAGLLLCVKRRVLEAAWTVVLSSATVRQLCFVLIVIYLLLLMTSSDSNC